MANSSYFAVDAASRKIQLVEHGKDDEGNDLKSTIDVETLDDFGVNTSRLEYNEWIKQVFFRRIGFTLSLFVPLVIVAGVGIVFWYLRFENLAPLPFVVVIPGFITYLIASRQLVKPVVIIWKSDADEFYATEDQFWIDEHRNFPEETRRFNGSDWIPWIDCRDMVEKNEVRLFDPWHSAQDFDEDSINASDIMGIEAYLQSSYNIGNMKPQESFLEANLPYIALTIGGFVAVFFAAQRIQDLVGV